MKGKRWLWRKNGNNSRRVRAGVTSVTAAAVTGVQLTLSVF